MPNTYTQIYIHYVFATKNRMRFLTPDIQQELYAYTAGITRELNCFMQCIGGMDDHIHLLVGLYPTLSVSEFAQKLKANTSRFINDKGWANGLFAWQEGFGAFSVSQSGLQNTREYILNQPTHHQTRSFLREYEDLLSKYAVNYDRRYIYRPCPDDHS